MYTDNSEYLCHYGIPGMRWGHRMSNKQAHSEYNNFYNSALKKEINNNGASKAAFKAEAYATKYKLRYRDGGKGTAKQLDTYDKLVQKEYDLSEAAKTKARVEAADAFIAKYGEKKYKHMKSMDAVNTHLAVATMLGLPLIAIAGISAALIKN